MHDTVRPKFPNLRNRNTTENPDLLLRAAEPMCIGGSILEDNVAKHAFCLAWLLPEGVPTDQYKSWKSEA